MLITKGNLIASKESLRLARLGYDLMDRKRIILMQELSKMIDSVKALRNVIDDAYQRAYSALERANISMGVVNHIASVTPVETGVKVVYRSVMGIEIPKVTLDASRLKVPYSLLESNSQLDEVYLEMRNVKIYTAQLAELDNGMYRLAQAIEKSRKRANALQKIVIPDLESAIRTISDALEEKEREEFIRMKMIKKR